MRYFLAILVNELTAEHRVIPLMDRHQKTVEQLSAEARVKTQMENAEVEIYEFDGPPVASWRTPAYVPADMTERTDGTFASADELRFRRMLES